MLSGYKELLPDCAELAQQSFLSLGLNGNVNLQNATHITGSPGSQAFGLGLDPHHYSP